MAYLLGVDTGGTYTDAVILEDERRVVARAKRLTTRHDLSEGITAAVRAVLEESGVGAGQIALASLSTTLATNALVEGQGGRVGLVYIGFRERDLAAHGLDDALRGDPVLVVAGGHSHAGGEAAPLDLGAVRRWLGGIGDVSAFAVAGQFATRNPAHEIAVAELIGEITGRPVSASHQLSARLGGPKRAVTAVLNARLVGLTFRLIGRAEEGLRGLGIDAPLMVVRGDGALISAEMARERPIETILSGPAASIVGARWLTGAEEALVSDIGGTTTDIAVLRGGRPAIDPAGARVGQHRTMVEAVAMRTTGLGGDSEVHLLSEGLAGGVRLGPRRLVPVALLAAEAPAVHDALDAQLKRDVPGEHDGRFLRAVAGVEAGALGAREAAVLARIEGVMPVAEVIRQRIELRALERLVDRGLVQLSGVTPTDASHVLGHVTAWDRAAAEKALRLFGRRRTGSGERLATEPEGLARMIVEQLTEQTCTALLEAGFAEEGGWQGVPEVLARAELMRRGLGGGHAGLVRVETGLAVDVVGLGASAASYYPAVGARLGCRMVLPGDGGVANAIGAVVGRVTIRKTGSVTAPSEGRFRVHLDTGPEDFTAAEPAMARLEEVLRAAAEAEAMRVGAEGVRLRTDRDVRLARAEGREVFLEAEIRVEASGRARIA